MDRRTIYVRDKTPSLGDSSSNSPDNASLSSSSKMPPNHSRGVPRSLWDATGHGFIEEFGEYVSRFIASPDNTGTLPPPSPPSGRGDVLRIRSAEYRALFGLSSHSFYSLPRLSAGLARPTPEGEVLRLTLERLSFIGSGSECVVLRGRVQPRVVSALDVRGVCASLRGKTGGGEKFSPFKERILSGNIGSEYFPMKRSG